jgi:hypothetical protein
MSEEQQPDPAGQQHDAPAPDNTPQGEDIDWEARFKVQQDLARKQEARAKANADAARELAKIKAEQGTDLEKAVLAARQETEQAVAAKYTTRLAGLSVRAAAGGKFKDPEDAVAHLQGRLGEFVGDDGEVDDKAIAREVEALLKARPYLGVEKPPASFDGGQRNGTTGVGPNGMDRLIRRQAGVS